MSSAGERGGEEANPGAGSVGSADLGQHAAKGIALRKRLAAGKVRTGTRVLQPR